MKNLSKRATPLVLGFLIGALFATLLALYLFITGILDVTASTYGVRAMLIQAVPRVAKDLVPWLIIWWFVTPAVQRIPFGRPWLALLSSAALGVVLVPRILNIVGLTSTELAALFLFGLILTLPVVRAKEVWLSTAFFIGVHFVNVSIMGMPFGGLGHGVFSSRLVGDTLITGGQLGPVFGFAGVLGQLWLAGSLLRHQRLLFAAAPTRFQPRGEGLRQLAIGLLLAAAGVSLLFVISLVTGQSSVGGLELSASAITNSLTTALPVAIAVAALSCLALVTIADRVVHRPWLAAILATAVAVVIHRQSPGTSAHSAAEFGALTLAATLAFANTHRLWMSIGLLYGWLLCEGPVFGFPTNEFQIGEPWFRQELTASAIFGGSLGPTASLLSTGVRLLLVIAVIFVTRSEKPRGA